MINRKPFYFAVLIFVKAQSMEIDLNLFDQLQLEEFSKLSTQDRSSLMPANYTADIERGRNVLRAMADTIVTRMQQMGSLQNDTDLNQQKLQGAQILIDRRESVLSKIPIEVKDVISARARAAQRLDDNQKAALQQDAFIKNREHAYEAICALAMYTFEELRDNKLIAETESKEEFIEEFLEKKIEQLKKVYQC